MKVKSQLFALVLMSFSLLPSAWACHGGAAALDRVIFQVHEAQWVSTETAKVTIDVNATLQANDLAKARNEILDNLNKVAKAEWQITQFNRSQDSSGLEKLNVLAEARVPENALTQLYTNAENVSKPGVTYHINHIDFTPSEEEVNVVQALVRQAVYEKVQAEMTQLNGDFSGQSYTVNSIDFVTGVVPMPGRKQAYQAEMAMVAAPMSVSNRVEVTATVVVASDRATVGCQGCSQDHAERDNH